MPNPILRFDIGCENRDVTEAFYTDVFGWRFDDNGPYSRAIVGGAEGGAEGSITALGHEPHQYVMIYVKVEDVAESIASVAKNGGEALLGPLPLPTGGHFAWFRDPGGNMIGLTDV